MLSEHFPEGVFHPVKTLGSRIGIVGLKHGRNLVVTHGIGTTIGQHIQKDVLGIQQEGKTSSG